MQEKGKDERILENFLESEWSRADSFFVYLSKESEASTRGIIEELLSRGKEVCVPLVRGEVMLSVPLKGEMIKTSFHTVQPAAGEERTCSIALVPLLALDRAGYRLGYGGGYYDRYFALHPKVFKIGLCYEGQAVEALPHEAHDIPLDCVIDENGIYSFYAPFTRNA